jgi:hypothetical protein
MKKLKEQLNKRKLIELEQKKINDIVDRNKEKEKKEEEHLGRMRGKYLKRKKINIKKELNKWISPSNRMAWALKKALKQKDRANSNVLTSLDFKKIQIAIVSGGGLGDILKTVVFMPEISNFFQCEITLITDQKAALALKENNGYIKNVIIAEGNPYDYAEDILQHANIFDAIMLFRYNFYYIIKENSRIKNKDFDTFVKKNENIISLYRKYSFDNSVWPSMNNALARQMIRDQNDIIETAKKSLGINIPDNKKFSIPFFIKPNKATSLKHYFERKYITIHHGFDLRNLPNKEIITDYTSTKNISKIKWKEIVKNLKDTGFYIIQLGVEEEEEIEGVDLCLNGLTTLDETALLLKYSSCHIDTEGGLVHLNRAVHGKSVVMFGPTPVEIFGYTQNSNIEPRGCKGCFWTTDSWLVECPLKTSGPECMESHDPFKIANEVKKILSSAKKTSIEFLDYGTYDIYETVSKKIRSFLLNTKIQSCIALYSKKDTDGIILCTDENRHKTEYNIATDNLETIETLSDNEVFLSSFINLRHESSSLDQVICLTDLWTEESAVFVFKEMLRVLKPGGILIGVIPKGNDKYINISDIINQSGVNILNEYNNKENISYFILNKSESDELENTLIEQCTEVVLECHGNNNATFNDINILEKTTSEFLDTALNYYDKYIQHKNESWDISDRIIQEELANNDWIQISSSSIEGYCENFLLNNWYGLEEWGCWGSGTIQSILLPIPNQINTNDSIKFEALLRIRFCNKAPSKMIGIKVNGKTIIEKRIYKSAISDDFEFEIKIDYKHIQFKRFIILEILSDSFFKPSEELDENNDERELGVGLIKFRYTLLNSNIIKNSNNEAQLCDQVSLGKQTKKSLAFLLAISGNNVFSAANVCIGINKHLLSDDYDILIYYKNIPEKDLSALKKIDHVTLVFHEFDPVFKNEILRNAPEKSRFKDENTLMAYCHFEAFKLLKFYKNVVWLDTDTLINKKIDDIVSKHGLSISSDDPWTVGDNFSDPIDGYDMDSPGMCTAVIALNDSLPFEEIYLWLYKKALIHSKILINPDQGIINLALQEFKISPNILDRLTWQCMPWEEKVLSANIIHFGGNNKIWDNTYYLSKFPEWMANHKKWIQLGGSDIYSNENNTTINTSIPIQIAKNNNIKNINMIQKIRNIIFK